MSVLVASKNDINRRFVATSHTWPTREDRNLKFRLVKGKGDRSFPRGFLAKYGSEFGNICFAIDHYDNCLPIHMEGTHSKRVIEEKTFQKMRVVYSAERNVTVKLKYVGHGFFYLSLWDRLNYELAVVPHPAYYVKDRLPKFTLELVEHVFKINYCTPADQPEVIPVGSHSDASEADSNSGVSSYLSHWKELRATDITSSYLYIPRDFARYLEGKGDGALWTVMGPTSTQADSYLFKARMKPRSPLDFRFGNDWPKFCRDHNLKPGDILQFGMVSTTNSTIAIAIDRD